MDIDWHDLGERMHTYVRDMDDCIHEAEFFDNEDLDWWAIQSEALQSPDFLPWYKRARHIIGRRIGKIALLKRGGSVHERYMRWMMDDFNAFMHQTHKEEIAASRVSQREGEEYALDKILATLYEATGRQRDEADNAESEAD